MGVLTAQAEVELLRCPRCRERQTVPTGTAAYRCRPCGVGWRWAECRSCRRIEHTLFPQQSWQCRQCRTFTRAWWHTPEAEREQAAVEAKRSGEATRTLRRWVLPAAAAIAGLLMVAAVITAGPTDGRAVASTEACRLFTEIRRHEAGGALTANQLERGLTELAAVAEDAGPELASAATELLGAAASGTDENAFQAGATNMQQACR